MHETAEDLARLQQLLDASDAAAGGHMRAIFDAPRRVDAGTLAGMLAGVQVLDLATVTSDCRPLVAPVDGLFYRGRFHFGSSPESVRFRHIRRNPAVSAAHTRGEELAVIVHGDAVEIDTGAPEQAGFVDYLVEVYGPQWHEWHTGAPYAYIEPRRMYTRWWRGEPLG